MCWDNLDTKILSAGFEGAIYEWQLLQGKRADDDLYTKGCEYWDICCNTSKTTGTLSAVAAGSDNKLKFIDKGQIVAEIVTAKGEADVRRVLWCASANTLIAGTSRGAIRLYTLPLSQTPPNSHHYAELSLHTAAVTSLALSHDESLLFCGSADGSMFVLDLSIFHGGRPVVRKVFDYRLFNKVALVDTDGLEEKTLDVNRLKEEMDRREMDNQLHLKSIASEYDDRLTATVEEYTHQMNTLAETVEALTSEKHAQYEALTKELKQEELTHTTTMEDMVETYERKLRDAARRVQEVHDQRDEMRVAFEDHISKLKVAQAAEIDAFKRQSEEERLQIIDEKQMLEEEYVLMRKQHEELIEQEKQEYESQIDEITASLSNLKQKDAQNASSMKTAAMMHRRKQDQLKDEITRVQSEKESREQTIEQLKEDIRDLHKKNKQLQEEIETRDKTIVTKEKRIMELKKQTMELDKLRFVLSYKYQELKKEIGPKEEQVQALAERIRQMDQELERLGLEKEALKQAVESKAEKVDALLHDISDARSTADERRRLFDQFRKSVEDMLSMHDEPRAILRRIRQLTEDMTPKGAAQKIREQPSENAALLEAERQRRHVNNKVEDLSKQLVRNKMRSSTDMQRRVGENAELLQEVNVLRHEKRDLQNKVTQLTSQIQNLEVQVRMASTTATQATGTLLPTTASSLGAAGAGGNMDDSQGTSSRPTSGTSLKNVDDQRVQTPDSYFAHRPSSSSGSKVVRGSNVRALRDGGYALDKLRIAEMLRLIELNHAEMERQKDEIHLLRAQVAALASSSAAMHQPMSPEDTVGRPSTAGSSSLSRPQTSNSRK
jgi:hypothetical protein